MATAFDNLYTISQVAELYDLDTSTIRKHIAAGKFRLGTEIKKFGNVWIITKNGINRVYGKDKYDIHG